MCYNPDRHHRRSIRLKGYDYRRAGAYFVTVCTRERECLFGEVSHGQVCLNALGQIVAETWQEIPSHFERAAVDALVVMPNHIHGVIVLKGEYGADAASAAREGRGTARAWPPTRKRSGNRRLARWQPSCDPSSLPPRNASTPCATAAVRRSGNGATTNTSSAMVANCAPSANTSQTIQSTGGRIQRIRRDEGEEVARAPYGRVSLARPGRAKRAPASRQFAQDCRGAKCHA